MSKIILGLLVAVSFPLAAQAQTGKHVAVGGSLTVHEYSDKDFKQSAGFSFLYRLSRTGHPIDGWSIVPSASIDYARTELRPDVGGSEVTLGRLRSVPALVGLGPQFRHGRVEVGLSAQAGASFNSFTVDQTGRTIYQDRVGADLEEIHTETSFAAKTGAGIWYDLNSRLGLYGGVSYLYSRPKAQVTTDGVTTEQKWNTDYVGLSVGAAVGLF